VKRIGTLAGELYRTKDASRFRKKAIKHADELSETRRKRIDKVDKSSSICITRHSFTGSIYNHTKEHKRQI